MAAIAVPLITALAPEIINLITSLIHAHATTAESNLGPGTGPVKFAQVFNAVMADLQTAAAAGKIDKNLPSDSTVQIIIQAVITSMQLAGLLQGGAVVSSTAPAPVTISAGQTISITAK